MDYSGLMDADNELLTELREKAPGTYKHSQNVMNLCESLAKTLNLDKDLLKCAAMYHDIGKMMNPKWFTENQDEENPHDNVPPELSYHIISRHIADSCLLLAQNGFPIEVIKVVAGYHGNTIIKYFWEKKGAREDNKDNYRYKAKAPDDIEPIILMIADRVEAQGRSMSASGKLNSLKEKKRLISDVIDDLSEDMQLEDLKIGQLRVIKDAMLEEVKSLYHGRVDYDDAKQETEE